MAQQTCSWAQPTRRMASASGQEDMCDHEQTLQGSPGCALGYTDACEIQSSSALLLHLFVHSSKALYTLSWDGLYHKLKPRRTELVLTISS